MLSGPGRRALLVSLCGLLVALGTWSVPGPAVAATDDQLVLVLDSSGSMAERVGGRRKIDIAKRALSGVVGGLPDEARVGLRVYGAEVFERTDPGACTDSQLVVPIGTDNRSELRDAVAGYEPFGETPISYSLRQAAKDLGPEGKRTVLLVSDGEETCDADPCATAAALARADVEVKIDVVGLAVSGRTRDQLRCVAERGNGTYYDADSADDLTASLDKLATRAFRPFRLTGTAVTGAADRADAPELRPGQYLDAFRGREEPLVYRLPRTAAGTTLRAGITTQPAGTVATAAVRLRRADGSECGNGLAQAIAIGGSSPLVSGEVDSWRSGGDGECTTEDELLVEVVSYAEELAGTPFELVLSEEPPVSGTAGLPPAVQEVRWERTSTGGAAQAPPVPGSSLSDAPTLEPGRYRTTVLTGESQVYAVEADWGQRVQVTATVAPRRGALAEALSVSDSLDLQLLAPGRGRYANVRLTGEPEQTTTMAVDATPFRVVGSTPTVRYLNRTSSGSESYAAVPGTQYVVLNLDRSAEDAFLVPYTLDVEVVGEAGEGAPAYDGEASASPTPSEQTSREAAAGSSDTAASQEPGEPDEQGAPVVLLSGLGVMLVAVAGMGYLLWRQRRRRAD
ncbi:VWA domain-containing protein [Nocardioides aurantiacus]|uniref:VWA domain-containing protein n=1 Tax=Nocardioides aurantiacus TaxID=86796 RepID=UPI00403F0853